MTDYISLADAWARFCEAEGVASVIDAMRARPTAVIVRDMPDPDDFPPEPKPIVGPGIVDRNRLTYFAGKFRDIIVLPLKDATFLLSDDGSHEPVTPAEWWKETKPHLFTNRAAEGLRIGTAFPLAIYFNRAAFEEIIRLTVDRVEVQEARKNPSGRKPAIDPGLIYAEVSRLMEHHGEFSPDDPAWDCSAKLEAALTEYIATKFDRHLAESTVRNYATKALNKWRAKEAGN